MKPFDIELAKQGKPVCTRDGRDARIICFDAKSKNKPIVALVSNGISEITVHYFENGRFQGKHRNNINDLFMKSEKHIGYACFQPLWDGRTYRVPIAAEICETPHCAKLTSKNPNDVVVKLEWEDEL